MSITYGNAWDRVCTIELQRSVDYVITGIYISIFFLFFFSLIVDSQQ